MPDVTPQDISKYLAELRYTPKPDVNPGANMLMEQGFEQCRMHLINEFFGPIMGASKGDTA